MIPFQPGKKDFPDELNGGINECDLAGAEEEGWVLSNGRQEVWLSSANFQITSVSCSNIMHG